MFKSNRSFVLQSLNEVDRGAMLLHSYEMPGLPECDIQISDVRALDIRLSFTGIQIELAQIDYLSHFPSKPAELIQHGLRIYAFYGQQWRGFVVGGAMWYREDNGPWQTQELSGC